MCIRSSLLPFHFSECLLKSRSFFLICKNVWVVRQNEGYLPWLLALLIEILCLQPAKSSAKILVFAFLWCFMSAPFWDLTVGKRISFYSERSKRMNGMVERAVL